eukprot:CAMPEP_0182829586 /NCGR_PEP_ID=MMETSP0006_2-20121128/18116_1 /TAXON_ID=97485 /ORGANISM="Prymnesium parvum, Strain Texoma1" /LENGTH=61 /DNA_ID=CAMNT_0024957087 /DNA_START=311 /DNA_END=496 /DNA_ORIENTATION=+
MVIPANDKVYESSDEADIHLPLISSPPPRTLPPSLAALLMAGSSSTTWKSRYSLVLQEQAP